MATATVPAAVPDPNEPPNTTTGNAPSGLLASMLAPVEPARPATFTIPTPAAAEGDTGAPVTGASSAAYHGTDEASATTQNNSASIDKKSIWRAWLMAGATRWGKGGGAHNKRMDMLKAKAAAHQVKEARQVSVNRSGGLLPGKGSAGSGGSAKQGGGKGNSGGGTGGSGASGKGPAKGPSNGQRNSNGNAHKGPSGRSGGSGGTGAGAGGGRGGGGSAGGNGSNDRGHLTSKTPRPSKADDASHDKGPKSPKVDLAKGKDRGSAGGGGGKSGATGPAGSPGKSSTTTGGGTSNSGGTKGTGPTGGTGKKDKVDLVKDRATGKGDKRPGKDHRGPGKDSAPKPTKHDTGKRSPAGASPGNNGPVSLTKDRKTKDSKTKGDKAAQPQAKTEPGKKRNGKPFTTKDSRETGYRDGIRAAIAVAHAKAYCDGVKDGWTDVGEAAERQKAELDKAHEKRKKAREAARDKETDVSAAGSSADHHKPQPIEVKGIDAKTLWLGEGADRNTISRGEVRSLKHFERRLEDRLATLRDSVERTKRLKAHAEEQARQVAAKYEAAKAVEGGEKLIARLAKLEEDAKAQVGLADEIHKRAVRSTDACAAALANAQVRYGAMYQAVIDSDETTPAEMTFYLDGATTSRG